MITPPWRPLAELSTDAARAVRVVFTDIDDTLTHDGLLEPEAFEALWALHRAGVAAVPVTGRPAGWCDHFARMWPVAGVVGENGALAFHYDREARRMGALWATSEAERATLQVRLATIRDAVLTAVPRARVAGDQPYRIHDLAIDFSEDVRPALEPPERQRILDLFAAHGATAKLSSIHVNGWFGAYDKLSMIRRFSAEVLGLPLETDAERRAAVYAGDSPNDEPAFAFFPLSVGVANVAEFVDLLTRPPRFITPSRGGRGFAELVTQLLGARRSSG